MKIFYFWALGVISGGILMTIETELVKWIVIAIAVIILAISYIIAKAKGETP